MADLLATLNPDTYTPPKSRIGDAQNCSQYVQWLMQADISRATNRTKIKGMFDGNAPYSRQQLKSKGMQSNTNLNFRQGKALLDAQKTPYYDLLTEVPMLADCQTAQGNSSEQAEWSQIISEEFHDMIVSWFRWDYISQFHQTQMLTFGPAILYFPDVWDWRPDAARTADILLQDGTSSSPEEWDAIVILKSYTAPNLYNYIRQDKAHEVGWNVREVEKAIIAAKYGTKPPGNTQAQQEWYQQKFKNADIFEGSYGCNLVNTAHVLVREFSREDKESCSHHMVRTDTQTNEFLYSKIDAFNRIDEMVIPFFYDIGDGTYHSINGLGKEIYPYIEVFNRLRCREVDGAMIAATILMQQQDATQSSKSQLLTLANLSIMPPGWSAVQTNIGQGIEATSNVRRDMEGGLNQNIGQIQTVPGAPENRQGQKVQLMQMQSRVALTKGSINRYYNSADKLFNQMFIRAAKSNSRCPGGKEAVEFQKKCMQRGVPKEALKNMTSVRAFRSVGAGSAASGLMIAQEIMQYAGSFPEEGRQQALRLLLSRLAGTHTMNSIMGEVKTAQNTDDMAIAALENSALRQGDHELVITQLQSNVRHLESHLGNMEEHVNEVQQEAQQGGGMNPESLKQLYIHLEAGGQHSFEHLERIKDDPIRQQDYKVLQKRWDELARIQDQVGQQVKEMMAAEQQAQAAAQPNPDALKVIPYKSAPESVKAQLEAIAGVQRAEGDASVEAQNMQNKAVNTDLKAQKQQQSGSLNDAKFALDVKKDVQQPKAQPK